jgi:hypothetical protein
MVSFSAWTVGCGCAGAPAVGYSEYSQWGTLRTPEGVGCAPLVLSRVAGPAARCGNKQTRLRRRQRQQATHRCGCERRRYCALLSRSAPWPPCHSARGRALAGWIGKSAPLVEACASRRRPLCRRRQWPVRSSDAHTSTRAYRLARMRFRTSHVDRSATPSGSVPCSVQVRRKASRETAVHPLAASHALAHHSARPCGPCTFADTIL